MKDTKSRLHNCNVCGDEGFTLRRLLKHLRDHYMQADSKILEAEYELEVAEKQIKELGAKVYL